MELIDGDVDYAFYLTMYEVLEEVVVHCDRAQNCESNVAMGVDLKMASMALRCALQIYRDRFGQPEVPKEEVK
jgi:hypothetical protein